MRFLKIKLPITTPTGKCRVKERNHYSEFGKPFPTRSRKISKECYLEWQIGYETEEKEKENVLKSINFKRNKKTKYGFELIYYFYKGLRNGIFNKKDLSKLIDHNMKMKKKDFLDQKIKIGRKENGHSILRGTKFKKFIDKYPVYCISKKDYKIEILVTHKQKAVGYQAMIYVCLPINNCNCSVIGRKANKKEIITIEISRLKNNFILEALKAFSIASEQHNKDIDNLMHLIKKKLNI